MRFLVCFLLIASSNAATVIKGNLENGTSGGAGSADSVQLVVLGQGMDIVAQLTNVSGEFELSYDGELEGRSWLVQAQKGRTIYSVQGKAISEPIAITVYDSATEADITARGGTIAVSAIKQTLDIGRFINLDNQTKPPVTLERDDGTFRFELEPGFQSVEASTSRGTMPLKQQLQVEGNTASLNYPLRPGRTQLMVRTAHVYNPSIANTYNIPLLQEQKFAHILVLPLSVEVEGDGVQFVSADDANGVKLYEWERQEGQDILELTVSGASADKVPEVAPGTQTTQTSQQQHSQGDVLNTAHPLDEYRWFIVAGVSVLMLVLSLAIRRF